MTCTYAGICSLKKIHFLFHLDFYLINFKKLYTDYSNLQYKYANVFPDKSGYCLIIHYSYFPNINFNLAGLSNSTLI